MATQQQGRIERGQRIRTLREESPHTQQSLADQIPVTLRAYQRWEEGGGIEWDHLEKLAEIHEVDVRWIHRGEEPPATPDLLATGARLDSLERQVAELALMVSEVLAIARGEDVDAGADDQEPDLDRAAKKLAVESAPETAPPQPSPRARRR